MTRADEPRHTGVEWETPPPTGKNRYDWLAIGAQLRAQPMTWGKIFDHDRTSVANAIRQGGVRNMHPDQGFEVRTSNNVRAPVRMCTMYLRYNPDKDQSIEQKGE